MNMMNRDNAIREKANQMGNALWWLAAAGIVVYLLWVSGTTVPWWIYPMLFARSVFGLAQALSDEPALHKMPDGYLPLKSVDANVWEFNASTKNLPAESLIRIRPVKRRG